MKRRIAAAFALAVISDAVQVPISLFFLTGWLAIPAELAIVAIDVITMGMLTWLLGFHWSLIAALGVEVLPTDLLPTWTAAVTYIVWGRQKAEKKSGPAKSAEPEIIIEIPQK